MKLIYLLFLCLFVQTVRSQCAVKIERISSTDFFVGRDSDSYYDSNYIGLKITTNSSTSLEDCWVTLSLPSTQTLQLAPLETGIFRIGAMNASTSQNAYFLLTGRVEGLNYYTATVYQSYPLFNETLCSTTFNTSISQIIK